MSPSIRRTFGPPPRGRRIALAVSIVAGLLLPVYFLGVAESSYLARDFHAYHAAAEAALAGRPFVGVDSGYPGAEYVYPPVAVLLFLPQAAAGGWLTAFALQTAINVAAATGVAALTVRTIERHGGRLPTLDRLLVAGFVLGAAPSVAVLGLGQVDMLVALALAGSFLALERGQEWIAGVAVAAAALVKLFPVVLGLWLLWRRSWRGLAGAVATGVAGIGLGALLFGVDAYRRYRQVLSQRSRLAEFAGTVSPDFFAMSLHRPLSQLLPGADPLLYVPLSALLLAPPLAVVLRRRRRFVDRLATFLVAVVATLLLSPASNSVYVVYVYVPVLCLLYLTPDDRSRLPLAAGTVAIGVPLQPAQIGAVLAVLGAPEPVHAAVLGASRSVLTVVSTPLLGLLVVLAWCTFHATRYGDERAERARPGGAATQRK
ncbi:DUF2029 domain-containing protein [Halolamina sp. CBA1230]|uniref:glycosyltransferase family 87 protein n=1 Tax=Halolamina sp. CBA1230 TaxID=1853690 RepID=UPI0009A18C09|nr:glycosyltransferase family 87 protein [Halolamina sp. CBA1230]QKY20768.1 DUF2029 domain-containing protein [Halolamina sp. CBA1230]